MKPCIISMGVWGIGIEFKCKIKIKNKNSFINNLKIKLIPLYIE